MNIVILRMTLASSKFYQKKRNKPKLIILHCGALPCCLNTCDILVHSLKH